ncbi:MAG: hypothetical protein KKE39_14320 [Bacteroidetes bacterium]|nr:hypothetical protein [Bacteroidota bacterium]MBU1371444.1 hypothetical protein [Bacteroidota bacterium]MBU1484010.1 hypothetical protein [Bacteroidota bacterium]MBU1759868.1 hypothetical protein [Bacteroidota bacterium]MBU2269078.1 hypothetical protein [Bacteroidota bacterium]
MKKELINRVASLGLLFWIIKIFSTTVGETAADYVSVNLNLGLILTTILMGVITIGVFFWNFKQKKYYPPSYWLLIVMMSIEGTLITDFLVDQLNVSLLILDIVFTIAMGLVFYFWYKKERSLSIHSINNDSREIFYWVIVLTTFALGTGIGDTVSEYLNFGYLNSLILFVSIFILAGALNYFKIINGVLAFWIAFIVTRPIGASLGDLLIQQPKDGGMGVSITIVNILFFIVIIASVGYLTNKNDSSKSIEV